MAGRRPRVTQATFDAALALPAVRQAVKARAIRALAVAQREAYAGGRLHFGDSLRLVDGVRPGTKSKTGGRRPYTRLEGVTTEAENYADARTARLSRAQIVRRGASRG